MTEHTPGPWALGRIDSAMSENFLKLAIGTKRREHAIAIIPVDDEESLPNARLIAAAPQMLNVLVKVAELLDAAIMNCDTDREQYKVVAQTVKEAIRKATTREGDIP